MQQHISDTAFVVNESRINRIDISKDVFAELWFPPSRREKIRSLWKDFLTQVFPYDDLLISIRNRYFLNHLNAFFRAYPNGVFVNLGAGFTSYPFLLDNPVRSIEVDVDHNSIYKQNRVADLIKTGALPHRDITFLKTDFNQPEDRQKLFFQLSEILADLPVFLLLEGVSYYLALDSFQALLHFGRELTNPHIRFAFDFWKPELKEQPICNKIEQFFAKHFEYSPQDYLFLDPDWIHDLDGYQILESTDVIEQELKIAESIHMQDTPNTLVENYVILFPSK
jgi:O-methyltransferase involved in polyketide biosynthesis